MILLVVSGQRALYLVGMRKDYHPRPTNPNGTIMAGLTRKQELFALAYVACGNASQAAREAGYALKSAHTTGHETLKNPEVTALIKDLTAKSANDPAKKILTAEQTLARMSEIAIHGEDGEGRASTQATGILMKYHGLLDRQAYMEGWKDRSEAQLAQAAEKALEYLRNKPKQVN